MSRQVTRNSQGDHNDYGPNTGLFDRLTLKKNIPQVFPRTAFGHQSKLIGGEGLGLYFDRLNSVDCPVTNGITEYVSLQNPVTKPYYSISSNPTVLSGATFIYSFTDNVLSINAVIPSGLADLPGSGVAYTLDIKVFNADNTLARVQAAQEYPYDFEETGLLARDGKCRTVSTVVRVDAGQRMCLFAAVNSADPGNFYSFFSKDMMYNTSGGGTALQAECCIDIQKM